MEILVFREVYSNHVMDEIHAKTHAKDKLLNDKRSALRREVNTDGISADGSYICQCNTICEMFYLFYHSVAEKL